MNYMKSATSSSVPTPSIHPASKAIQWFSMVVSKVREFVKNRLAIAKSAYLMTFEQQECFEKRSSDILHRALPLQACEKVAALLIPVELHETHKLIELGLGKFYLREKEGAGFEFLEKNDHSYEDHELIFNLTEDEMEIEHTSTGKKERYVSNQLVHLQGANYILKRIRVNKTRQQNAV